MPLACIWAHDVNAQNLVGLGIRNELDHTLCVIHTACTAVGHEGKLAHLRSWKVCADELGSVFSAQLRAGRWMWPVLWAHLVCYAFSLDLLLCFPHTGHLWPSIHNRWHSVVVDVTASARQQFHACDTILLCLHSGLGEWRSARCLCQGHDRQTHLVR